MQTNNKETEILKAAEELFAEKGFKGATTTLIASKAGVTHAMLHYYFRTKEHIFIKVMEGYMREMMGELKEIMITGVHDVELIGKVTEKFFDFFCDHKDHLSLILEVTKDQPDILADFVGELDSHMGQSFRAHKTRTENAVASGELGKIEFNDLITDIITVCAAPLLFEPMVRNVLKMDSPAKEAFYAARKKEAVALVTARLKP